MPWSRAEKDKHIVMTCHKKEKKMPTRHRKKLKQSQWPAKKGRHHRLFLKRLLDRQIMSSGLVGNSDGLVGVTVESGTCTYTRKEVKLGRS